MAEFIPAEGVFLKQVGNVTAMFQRMNDKLDISSDRFDINLIVTIHNIQVLKHIFASDYTEFAVLYQ